MEQYLFISSWWEGIIAWADYNPQSINFDFEKSISSYITRNIHKSIQTPRYGRTLDYDDDTLLFSFGSSDVHFHKAKSRLSLGDSVVLVERML